MNPHPWSRGIFSNRVRRMFGITQADWDIMSSPMKETYSNQYRFAHAKFQRDLKQLGIINRYMTCINSMEDLGYIFDPFISTSKRIYFYYEGGETYFGGWSYVIQFLNAYYKGADK